MDNYKMCVIVGLCCLIVAIIGLDRHAQKDV